MKNKYRLSIFRTGGTARILAHGNDDSCFITTKNNENEYNHISTNAIKFHHNALTDALKNNSDSHLHENDLLSYEDNFSSDEDYFVEFESSTRLVDFYWDLMKSDFSSPTHFSFTHNCADGANYALSKIHMLDVFLMASPSESEDYLDSHKNTLKLYLYKNDEKICLYLNGKPCYLPDSIVALAKECVFDQPPNNPNPCSNKTFCDAVLDFTSKQGYTNTNFNVTFKKTFNRYNATTFCRIPFLSTPYELFLSTKEFKIKQLEDRKFPFQLELAKKALQFRFRMHHTNVPLEKIDEIINEIDKRLIHNFHHAEFYLKLLIDTNDIIIQSLKHQQNALIDPYKQSATFFKNREPSKVNRGMDETIALNIFLLVGTCMISNCISYHSNQFFLKDFSMFWKIPAYIFSNVVVSQLLSVLLHKYLYPYTDSINEKRIQQEIKDCHTTVETTLSRAITNLAVQLESSPETALTCRK